MLKKKKQEVAGHPGWLGLEMPAWGLQCQERVQVTVWTDSLAPPR